MVVAVAPRLEPKSVACVSDLAMGILVRSSVGTEVERLASRGIGMLVGESLLIFSEVCALSCRSDVDAAWCACVSEMGALSCCSDVDASVEG